MPQTLEAIWTTPALTTPGVLVRRAERRGQLVNLVRADSATWPGLSDEERRALVTRLDFVRWRINRDDTLRRRTAHEGSNMGTLWLDCILVLAVICAAIDATAGRIWRWRP